MKILIVVACAIAGEAFSSHADVGDVVDVPKDDAASLTRMGRAMYLDKSEDPTKGALTAGPEEKAAVKRAAAAHNDMLKEREAAAAVNSPAGISALMVQAVATAVTAALSAAGVAKPAAVT